MADTYNVDFGIGSRIHLLFASKLVGPLGALYNLDQFYVLHPKEKIQSIFLSLENGIVYQRHITSAFDKPNTELFFLFMLGVAKSMADLQKDTTFESLFKVESIGGGNRKENFQRISAMLSSSIESNIPINFSDNQPTKEVKKKETLNKTGLSDDFFDGLSSFAANLETIPGDFLNATRAYIEASNVAVNESVKLSYFADLLKTFLDPESPTAVFFMEIAQSLNNPVSDEDEALGKLIEECLAIISKRAISDVLFQDMICSDYLELSNALTNFKKFPIAMITGHTKPGDIAPYVMFAKMLKPFMKMVLTRNGHPIINQRIEDLGTGKILNKDKLLYSEYSKLLEFGKIVREYVASLEKSK